jgi:hypothetical protein
MAIYLGGFDFDGPYRLDHWNPPHEDGVYVLMRRTEMADGTTSFTPIYFGETDDLAAHDFPAGHPRYACWVKEAGSLANLTIGVHYMPGAMKFARQMIETTLLGQYHPVCNYDWPHMWAVAKEIRLHERGRGHSRLSR